MYKLILILVLFSFACRATNRYVAKTGSDGNDGLAWGTAYATIQKAASVVNAGDVVTVRAGTYTNNVPNYGSEQVVVLMTRSGNSGAYITFKSEYGTGVILDGQNFAAEYGIMFNNASYVKIEGFEILHIGIDAISIFAGSSYLELRDNHIHHIANTCSTSTNGLDGFHLMQCSHILIERNTVNDIGRLDPEEGCATGTTTYYDFHDHGIYLDGANYVTIRYNVFYNTHAGWAIQFYSGGGYASTNVSIVNNTFAFGKWAEGFIVLYNHVSNTDIQNNIFYQDIDGNTRFTPSSNHAIMINTDYPYSAVTINHNMVYRGSGLITAGAVTGVTVSANYESTNPLLVYPSAGDFSLQSNSPAINKGVDVGLTTDFLLHAITGLPDLGAYEYTSGTPAPSTAVHGRIKWMGKTVQVGGKSLSH